MTISTGMTIEQVREQFDIPRLEAFNQYSAYNPPLHVMVARYLGIEPKKRTTETKGDDLADLLQFLPVTP